MANRAEPVSPGNTPTGPCLNGSPGKDGTRGLDGTKAVNLFMYLEKVTVRGQLIVDLGGGKGGRGGHGGQVAAEALERCIAMEETAQMEAKQVRVAMVAMAEFLP